MRSIALIISLCIASWVTGQVDPQAVGSLPALITEASGLQCPSPSVCWTFNDSDDGSRLFRISDTGGFLSQIILENTEHIDYEDIARSSSGDYFIGDFGNNENDRTDLTIYKTSDLEAAGSSSIGAEVIGFSLPDQVDFPPAASQRNYDIESMIAIGDSLYLFTRNRTEPYTGWTKIYLLPAEAGSYQAFLVDSIFGNLSPSYSSVTAADINPAQDRIILLTKGSLFILSDFENGFSDATISYNFFSTVRNYEGISFINDCEVLLIEEGPVAQLYVLDSCDILSTIDEHDRTDVGIIVRDGILSFSQDRIVQNIRILDSLGRIAHHEDQAFTISLKSLSTGLYLISYSLDGQNYQQPLLVQ